MPVLTREEFDAIEFEAALTGDHQAAAERMVSLAETGTQSESMARAEAYVRAGEQWLLADNPGAAANDFRMAMADGGPVDVDPRAPLSRALFQLGDRDQAYALIEELKSEGRTDARACDMITELLVEQSDLPAALDWATAGVELMLRDQPQTGTGTGSDSTRSDGTGSDSTGSDSTGSDSTGSDSTSTQSADSNGTSPGKAQPTQDGAAGSGLRDLLRLRFRIRNDLRLPEDDYDRLLGS